MSTSATAGPRRRIAVVVAGVLVVLLAFVFRLVDIQVVNAGEYRAQAEGLEVFDSSRTVYGSRGTIVDENGSVMADNVPQYDIDLDPANIFNRKDEAGELVGERLWQEESADIATILGMQPEEVRSVVAGALAENPESRWVPLAKGVSTQQYVALRDLGLDSYLSSYEHPKRSYPDGAVGGNLIGFVGSDGEALAGLELAYEECLAPQHGTQSWERGVDGVVIPGTEQTSPAVDGGTLQLTINRDLQWYLTQLLAEEVQRLDANYATAFVLEVKTGKIRAAAEYPVLDPNDPLASDADARGSRIFTASFEPGSTFKAVTAATVVEEGKATPTTPTVSAEDREELAPGVVIGDALGHERMDYTLAGALIDSSNVAISKFGAMVDDKTRYEYLKKFGVGEQTAVGFPGEAAGVVHEAPWDDATAITTAFGQGLTVTVPQVASAFQTIANDGVRLPLRLVEGCEKADGTVEQPAVGEGERVLRQETAEQVQLMLDNVTAQGSLSDELAVPGYRVATKTGTAEKPDPETGGYKQGIYYTSLAGFVPADDPQYVVVLTLDEPKQTRMSSANASGFQKAMTQVLKTYRVLPTGSTEPQILPKEN